MRQLVIMALLAFFSCYKEGKRPPIDDAVDLDGHQVFDSSLIVPAKFLLTAHTAPTEADKDKLVVMTIHGFSATNFEWQEFASWSNSKPDLLVSRVLVGG